MSEMVIVIGGSGHAKVVMDCIRAAGDVPLGILDDGLEPGTRVLEVPVLGNTTQWRQFENCRFLIAIGNPQIRRRLAQMIEGPWYTAIHPGAWISPWATLGGGTVVMPGAVVNAGACVGAHCILNTNCVIEHDDILLDYVHVSPQAALGGTVTVGAGTHIGIGAAVKNNVCICGDCTIGAGAAVVKDIREPGIYVGVPARRIQ